MFKEQWSVSPKILRLWSDYINYSHGMFLEDPDDLLARDPIAYEKRKQEMITSSKLYVPPKNTKLESNDYD